VSNQEPVARPVATTKRPTVDGDMSKIILDRSDTPCYDSSCTPIRSSVCHSR
jgi:hypothetical protein